METVSEAYPGFLESGDLDGKDRTLTIEAVRDPTPDDKGIDGRPIDKPIVRFAGAKKEWVLNKTNAKTIRLLYGNKFAHWQGKKVTLYPTTCNAFGEPNVPCIRVRCLDPATGQEPSLL